MELPSILKSPYEGGDASEKDELRFAAIEEGQCYFFLATTDRNTVQSATVVSDGGRLRAIPEEQGRMLASEYEASGDNSFDTGDLVAPVPQAIRQ
ncbi:MAG: hypothetical protein KKH12_10100 [Gammaproteobacteria bacterium]|nr:hypothetical protein [Gammaproteobacteria bacterium]MBU1482013.1 hypothetical protein [Gammaproteobacteria bacterium]